MLDHESWHKQIEGASTDTDDTLTASITGAAASEIMRQETKVTQLQPPDMLVPALKMIEATKMTQGPDWDNATEEACIAALTVMDSATNSAGMAPCYNIKALNRSSGLFEADLRIFQISIPQGEWKDVSSNDMDIGLNYSNAKVTQQRGQKRKRNVDEGVAWSPVYGQASSDWLHGKSDRLPPRKIGYLELVGQVDQDAIGWLKDKYITREHLLGQR